MEKQLDKVEKEFFCKVFFDWSRTIRDLACQFLNFSWVGSRPGSTLFCWAPYNHYFFFLSIDSNHYQNSILGSEFKKNPELNIHIA